MQETLTLNRPPAFNLATIYPSSPVVTINLGCPAEETRFDIQVLDLDVDQSLTALWFLDYPVAGDDPDQLPLNSEPSDQFLRNTGRVDREASFDLRHETFQRPGVHTLEIFVIETQALRGDTSSRPFYRNPWVCNDPEAPPDCIRTHPAVMRWALNIVDEACP